MKEKHQNSQEIEYKWHAKSPHDFELFLQKVESLDAKLSKLKKVLIHDHYVDTPKNFFQNSQLECRIRLSEKHYELTLKSFRDEHFEAFVRMEKTIRLPNFPSKQAALTYCQAHFFEEIQPLFELSNERHIHTITLSDGTCLEASFDQVTMLRGEKKFSMNEIELEFKCGAIKTFEAFVKGLGPLDLKPSPSSKYTAGMNYFRIETPPSFKALHDVASQSLKANMRELKDIQVDFNAIHDRRVAIRKIRAALKTFKKSLEPKAERMRNQLKALSRLLGKKRDLDIFLSFIQGSVDESSHSFLKIFQESEKCRRQIVAKLESEDYRHLVHTLEDLKISKVNKNTLDFAKNQIQKSLDQVLEIASFVDPQADDKTLHKLRITLKKLRYVSEFFEETFKSSVCSISCLIEKTKNLQGILGDHQDAITGLTLLSHYKNAFSLESFLKIEKNYTLKKKKAKQQFFRIWKDFWFGPGFLRLQAENGIELIFS